MMTSKLSLLLERGPQHLPWFFQVARPGVGPRVCFGRRKVAGKNEFAHGGEVKLQHLTERFPNSPGEFNLVYLVSSSLLFGSWFWASIAKRKGAKIVLNQNGVAYPGWHGAGWQKTNRSLKRVLELADVVLYQSQFCQATADRFLGVPSGRREILYNPVDTEFFRSSFPRKTGNDEWVILLGGNQYQWYRLQLALKTIALLRKKGIKCRLLVSGSLGWTNEKMSHLQAQSLIRELALEKSIDFIGRYRQQQASDLFSRAHLLLHPKYNDPCPGLVLEAMACGLPVVYSKTGGTPELVGPDAGIGIETQVSFEQDCPPSPEKLAEGVEKILENLPWFSKKARERARENFGVRKWVGRHETIFEELLRT